MSPGTENHRSHTIYHGGRIHASENCGPANLFYNYFRAGACGAGADEGPSNPGTSLEGVRTF